MMVMTAKLNLKKILMILTAAAAVVLSLILLLGGDPSPRDPQSSGASAPQSQAEFLREKGWDVADTPTETSQVRIPQQTSQVFERYINLQKSQGYDLSQYAGKTVQRLVYPVTNYPGAAAPVYATLLVFKDQIIGGDITDTSPNGKIRGFLKAGNLELPKPQVTLPAHSETVPETASTAPSESSAPTVCPTA